MYLKLLVFISFSFSLLQAGLFDFNKINKLEQSYKQGDYKRAKEELLLLKDNSAVYHYNLANIHYKLGEYKEAIHYYKRAFGDGVNEHDRLYNLGNTFYMNKEYKKAIVAYKYALKLKADKETIYNLKLAIEALKRPKKSKEQDKDQRKQKQSKKPTKKSDNKQKEARKLTKKELKALQDLKRKREQKKELKKMLQKTLEEKKVPVIMYPINRGEQNSKEPW